MTRRSFGLLTVLLLVSLLAGCSLFRQAAAKYPAADLSYIYAWAVENPWRNPVVLVPGFGGSRLLLEEDGSTAWGAFFADDSLKLKSPIGQRALAVDIDRLPADPTPEDLRWIEDDVVTDGLLDSMRADALVAELDVNVYGVLTDLFESAGYAECGPSPVAGERPDCLTFSYDWRQDLVGSAIELGRFLEEARREIEAGRAARGVDGRPVRFDIVAHSMGGLVARYFLRYGARDVLGEEMPEITWEGADLVDRLIVVSTPNFGSMKLLRDMLDGRSFAFVDFEPAVIATWTSTYQMLPRESHRSWFDEQGEPASVAILSAAHWRRNGWGPFDPGQASVLANLLPGEATDADRRARLEAFMEVAFERARRFQRVVDRIPEVAPPADLFLLAADAERTPARAMVVRVDGRERLVFDLPALQAPGDGTITRASALADGRLLSGRGGWVESPIPWRQATFLTASHRSLLANPTFQNNLLHILLETAPRSRD
ncbi:MAG: hypothetical protein R3244_03770 [Thermoanaerobaculia bacterium]|nr:hypothetical protein [Thermoanaerobaculia bacterium]